MNKFLVISALALLVATQVVCQPSSEVLEKLDFEGNFYKESRVLLNDFLKS